MACTYAQLCCEFDEVGIHEMLRAFSAPPSARLRSIIADNHVFEALSLLQRQDDDLRGAQQSAALHMRTVMLDLRTLLLDLAPLLNGAGGGCGATEVLDAVLHDSAAPPGAPLDVARKLPEGVRLRLQLEAAVEAARQGLQPGEGCGGEGQAAEEERLAQGLLELLLGLFGELAVAEELAAGAEHDARTVCGRLWKELLLQQLCKVLRSTAGAGSASDETLERALEELARQGDDGAPLWQQEVDRWHALSGRGAARAERAAEARASICTAQRRWQVSVAFCGQVVHTQRAFRKVRERLLAVLSDEFFEVEGAWLSEMHRPVFVAAADVPSS